VADAGLAVPLVGRGNAFAAPSVAPAAASAAASAVHAAHPALTRAHPRRPAHRTTSAATRELYTMAPGDWLSKIADAHHVPAGWQRLYQLNRATLTAGLDLIFPGQQLRLGGRAPVAASTAPAQAAPFSDSEASTGSTTSGGSSASGGAAAGTTASDASASGSGAVTSGDPQAIAAQIVPADQLASFDEIISHESGWDVSATNPATRLRWALDYMDSTYGSPNQAWAFWQAHNWY
jgi:LysM repeat protein